jgi:uncharacterized protein (TIGR03437 family)
LSNFLASIKYTDGTQVTSIDLVAHGIGGLIARAYLEGLQTNQAYLPPYSPPVAHLVMIGVPNFGSFVVGNESAQFQAGSQGAELIPGSALLWNLATWNQRGDDLAGVSAIAIVGNAGSYATLTSTTTLLGASDGLVSTTSAALGFITPTPKTSPTRIVPYCQVDPSVFTNTALLGTFACASAGIANVSSTSHLTGQIVRSFLAGNTTWQSVGTSPSADQWLKTDGGVFFALQGATGGYATDLSAVTWGSGVTLTNGGNFGTIYYADFVSGTGNFTATSSSLGGTYPCSSPLALQAGYFQAYRCKLDLAISCPPGSTTCQGAITPTTTPGVAVTSGGTLTLTGVDFGSQCSTCKVYATPAGVTTPTALTVTSWSTTSISAQLPSTLTGYQVIQVNGTSGVDAMGVRALASVSAPTLSLTPTSLSFAYTTSGNLPASQSFAIANSGSGTLTWTGSVNAAATWLSIDTASGTAPSTVNVSVNPALLAVGTYTGTVTLTATGAGNSPAAVTVTLVVTGAAASLLVTPASLSFQYTSGGSAPAAQTLTISNGGSGSFNWVATSAAYWAALSATSGSVPGTVNVSTVAGNLAPGSYNTTVTIAAADNSVTAVSVPVTITVTGTPPTPVITAVANAGGYQTNIAAATWVAIFGTNLSQTTYSWQAGDFANGALPTSLQGVSVTIDGYPAYVAYISPTQINVLAPDDVNLGAVPVVVSTAGQSSAPVAAQKNAVSPAFLTFDGTNVAALHLNYTALGPSAPAAAGETIVLYGVGFGPTNPTVPTGQQVTTAEPLAGTVTMTIGGISVTPSFAGISSSGLYQFNVVVPASLSTGNAVLSATIGGVTTQTGVVIAVQ